MTDQQRLEKLIEAAVRARKAFDLNDEIGDNIDKRHCMEEDAVAHLNGALLGLDTSQIEKELEEEWKEADELYGWDE